MTNKSTAQVSAITEDDQLVILAVGVSLLVVVMAVIVGSFLFLWRRRRTSCWRGRRFRTKPERVHTISAREARLSYPTWPCNHVVAKGRCRLPLSDRYMSPQTHRERSEAKFSPCVALPSSTSEQLTPSNLNVEQARCTSRTTQASALHQRPLSNIYRTYSPSSLSWASHQSCWNTAKQAELCGPHMPFAPPAKLDQAALGIMPFLMNSWPRHPSHHGSAEVVSNSPETADRGQAKAGNKNLENEVPPLDMVASGSVRPSVRPAVYIRQTSFPPAAAILPAAAPKSPLAAPCAEPSHATPPEQRYDRSDLFRTIQLLRAKNDWVRHTRLARLRSPHDCFGSRPPLSGDGASQGIAAGRPMHSRCFSEPSASYNGAQQRLSTPAVTVANGAASQPLRADLPDAKARLADRRGLSQRTTRAVVAATNAQGETAARVCTVRPARGGTVVYPRRVTRPSAGKPAPSPGSCGRQAAISGCGGLGAAPSASQHVRSLSASGGASAPIGCSSGEPARSVPPRQWPQLLDVLKLRSGDVPRPSDDELVSSEPPSLCDVSLNSSLTPELSTARDRRRPTNDAGGSTSADDKYEFDLRTPG